MKRSYIILICCFLGALQAGSSSCSAHKAEQAAVKADTIPGKFSPITLSDNNNTTAADRINFVAASKLVTPAVAHIKTMYTAAPSSYQFQMGGSDVRRGTGSGSGVIITQDGFIATNNHVVENASDIQVILPDKRVFPAKLIGRDPNTDMALIKIATTGLPIVKFGNSDKTEVGEWVLAVGYPFSLNTTVTAGIVSAKARSIGIIQGPDGQDGAARTGSTAIESFIQTDAAINPGNSGGALVNTNGELVGINSAIASQTGSYAGYAFAVPSNLAKKILDDLQRFGAVKRGFLGVSFPAPAVEDQYFQQKGLVPGSIKGVYITGVAENSGAAAAGLREGDIIQSIDNIELASSSEFSERIARHRPGETVPLTYLRDNKPVSVTVTLKGEETAAASSVNKASLQEMYERLGATFEPLPASLKQRYNLTEGVVVSEVKRGGFFYKAGIPPGTIIAFINGIAIATSSDIDNALLTSKTGNIQVFAIAPDGSRVIFNFSLGT